MGSRTQRLRRATPSIGLFGEAAKLSGLSLSGKDEKTVENFSTPLTTLMYRPQKEKELKRLGRVADVSARVLDAEFLQEVDLQSYGGPPGAKV